MRGRPLRLVILITLTTLHVSDVLKTTTPLLTKVILTWLTQSYIYYRLSDEQQASGLLEKPRGIGYGIGLAFALFVMQGKHGSDMLFYVSN